jgi:hypothetical protein
MWIARGRAPVDNAENIANVDRKALEIVGRARSRALPAEVDQWKDRLRQLLNRSRRRTSRTSEGKPSSIRYGTNLHALVTAPYA